MYINRYDVNRQTWAVWLGLRMWQVTGMWGEGGAEKRHDWKEKEKELKLLKCIKWRICGQQTVKQKVMNSLQANNEICRHYGSEKLVQILKRQNANWETKLKENCVLLIEGGRFLFSFFGEPSTFYFLGRRRR